MAERSGRCVLRVQVAIEDVNISQRKDTGTTGDWATLTFAIERDPVGHPDRAADVIEANREQSEDLDPLRAGTILTLP